MYDVQCCDGYGHSTAWRREREREREREEHSLRFAQRDKPLWNIRSVMAKSMCLMFRISSSKMMMSCHWYWNIFCMCCSLFSIFTTTSLLFSATMKEEFDPKMRQNARLLDSTTSCKLFTWEGEGDEMGNITFAREGRRFMWRQEDVKEPTVLNIFRHSSLARCWNQRLL